MSFHVDLPHESRKILELMGEAGILGATAEEVAAYLITRELDDLLRSGSLKFGDEPATAPDSKTGCEHGIEDIFDCPECAPF